MYPVLFEFQWLGHDYRIGSYGVFIIIALFVGIFISSRVGVKLGFEKKDILSYIELIALGGVLGAFLIGFILFLPERIDYGFWSYPPALVSWGGFLGGFITFLLIKRAWRFDVLTFLDACSPGYLFGYGIGRIGCHFGGCCYGRVTDSSIGILFTHPMAPATSMGDKLIPAQLISSSVLLTLGIVFLYIALKNRVKGTTFFLSIICYTIFRFTIEFWRADPRSWFLGLSDGQLYSSVVFIISLFFFIGLLVRNRKSKSL